MSASEQLKKIVSNCGVIPTLAIEDLNSAVLLAQALCDGGLNVLEVTLRTPVALPAIQQIRQALPDVVVGAGTVCDVSAALAAHDVGAQFLVSPGYATNLGGYARPMSRCTCLSDRWYQRCRCPYVPVITERTLHRG